MKKIKRGKQNQTLEGLIRAECANFQSGACLGMDVHARFCVPLEKCLIPLNLPCSYFEQCLLPLARKLDKYSALEGVYSQRFPPGQRGDFDLVDELSERLGNDELRQRYQGHPFYESQPLKPQKVRALEGRKE